jgi:hypothetical protein
MARANPGPHGALSLKVNTLTAALVSRGHWRGLCCPRPKRSGACVCLLRGRAGATDGSENAQQKQSAADGGDIANGVIATPKANLKNHDLSNVISRPTHPPSSVQVTGQSRDDVLWSRPLDGIMLGELLDREELFKKQIEECLGLARNAVNGTDRAFWERAAAGWKEQLRGIKQKRRRATGTDTGKPRARQRFNANPRRAEEPRTDAVHRPNLIWPIGAMARWFARTSH